jgi:hypothetical protein
MWKPPAAMVIPSTVRGSGAKSAMMAGAAIRKRRFFNGEVFTQETVFFDGAGQLTSRRP